MSQRTYVRTIAKARLEAMGISHVNRVMGLGLSHTFNQNMQRTSQGRKQLAKIRKQRQPLWRRVTGGDMSADGYRAQIGIGRKRKLHAAQ